MCSCVGIFPLCTSSKGLKNTLFEYCANSIMPTTCALILRLVINFFDNSVSDGRHLTTQRISAGSRTSAKKQINSRRTYGTQINLGWRTECNTKRKRKMLRGGAKRESRRNVSGTSPERHHKPRASSSFWKRPVFSQSWRDNSETRARVATAIVFVSVARVFAAATFCSFAPQ